MFKKAGKIIKYSTLGVITFIAVYLVVALVSSNLVVNNVPYSEEDSRTIYLKTNGVHLDIVLKVEDVSASLDTCLFFSKEEKYLAFGWGDENFYIHTPTWNDLTFKTAFGALFLKSSTLVHVTKYKEKRSSWVAIRLTPDELKNINKYLFNTFSLSNKQFQEVGSGYSNNDNFYQAKGSYSLFNTCNTWANKGFKQSGLKSCRWTPFDFGLLNQYR